MKKSDLPGAQKFENLAKLSEEFAESITNPREELTAEDTATLDRIERGIDALEESCVQMQNSPNSHGYATQRAAMRNTLRRLRENLEDEIEKPIGRKRTITIPAVRDFDNRVSCAKKLRTIATTAREILTMELARMKQKGDEKREQIAIVNKAEAADRTIAALFAALEALAEWNAPLEAAGRFGEREWGAADFIGSAIDRRCAHLQVQRPLMGPCAELLIETLRARREQNTQAAA